MTTVPIESTRGTRSRCPDAIQLRGPHAAHGGSTASRGSARAIRSRSTASGSRPRPRSHPETSGSSATAVVCRSSESTSTAGRVRRSGSRDGAPRRNDGARDRPECRGVLVRDGARSLQSRPDAVPNVTARFSFWQPSGNRGGDESILDVIPIKPARVDETADRAGGVVRPVRALAFTPCGEVRGGEAECPFRPRMRTGTEPGIERGPRPGHNPLPRRGRARGRPVGSSAESARCASSDSLRTAQRPPTRNRGPNAPASSCALASSSGIRRAAARSSSKTTVGRRIARPAAIVASVSFFSVMPSQWAPPDNRYPARRAFRTRRAILSKPGWLILKPAALSARQWDRPPTPS